MNPWAATVDFGVVHPMAYPQCRTGEGPQVQTLQEIVADEFFGAVEIAPIKDPAERRRAQALLAASQLQVVYLPILPVIIENLDVSSADAAARNAALTRMKQFLDEAVEFDATLAMIGPPRDPGASERAAVTERLVQALRELCDYADATAGRRRLFLTLENFDRTVEKKRLIGPTAEAVAVAAAVGRENFGLTVDLSHLPLLGETPAQALRTAAPHLIHVHIGNCVLKHPESPLYGDFHPRFGHPQGENDLPQVVEYLRELHGIGHWERARQRVGARPILSMEVKPDDELSQTILANGKRTFARAWAVAAAKE